MEENLLQTAKAVQAKPHNETVFSLRNGKMWSLSMSAF